MREECFSAIAGRVVELELRLSLGRLSPPLGFGRLRLDVVLVAGRDAPGVEAWVSQHFGEEHVVAKGVVAFARGVSCGGTIMSCLVASHVTSFRL